MERRAGADRAADIDGPLMQRDNMLQIASPSPVSFGARCEKGLKNLGLHVRRNPASVIGDVHVHDVFTVHIRTCDILTVPDGSTAFIALSIRLTITRWNLIWSIFTRPVN